MQVLKKFKFKAYYDTTNEMLVAINTVNPSCTALVVADVDMKLPPLMLHETDKEEREIEILVMAKKEGIEHSEKRYTGDRKIKSGKLNVTRRHTLRG